MEGRGNLRITTATRYENTKEDSRIVKWNYMEIGRDSSKEDGQTRVGDRNRLDIKRNDIGKSNRG
jgi:hypothetical protein